MELDLESRMKLHDIRDHMHLYAGRRELKEMTLGRLDELFTRALRELERGEEHDRVLETLAEGRELFGEFLVHDRSMDSAYDRIVAIVLSTADPGATEPMSLARVVREEVAYFHNDLRLLPADRLVFVAQSDPWIECDEIRLRRVLANLLTNAAEAVTEGNGEDGGVTVEVDLASVAEPRDGVLSEITSGNYATLVVRDEGAGIPESSVQEFFKPGVTRKEDHLGLGLTFVKQVAEEMDAHIEIVPVEPRGTAIRLFIPLVDPPEGRAVSGAAGEAARAATRSQAASDDEARERAAAEE